MMWGCCGPTYVFMTNSSYIDSERRRRHYTSLLHRRSSSSLMIKHGTHGTRNINLVSEGADCGRRSRDQNSQFSKIPL